MSANYVLRIHAHGGAGQLQVEEVDVPVPGAGEVLVRNTAIGLNFIDVYHRNGLYPLPLPLVPGLEGAGVIEALGPDVTDFEVGDRVAYTDPIGAYALRLLRPVARLVKIPSGVSDDMAAASMLKGITAHYLLHSTYSVMSGDTILVHAAAGGVGQILCQWANARGATVIGTVGSEAKVEAARQAGCEYVLVNGNGAIAPRVRGLTAGAGVRVVYDGVGQATFMDSLDCLRPRGLMVSYGNASGAVESFSPGMLATKGSLYLTRPTLNSYIASGEELRQRAADVFTAITDGSVKLAVNARYPLREAAQAHRDLEGRKTQGSTLLIP